MTDRPDWSADLAMTIALDLHAVFHTSLELELVAARLRKLKLEGERDGLAEASKAIADSITLLEEQPSIEVVRPRAVDGCGNA